MRQRWKAVAIGGAIVAVIAAGMIAAVAAAGGDDVEVVTSGEPGWSQRGDLTDAAPPREAAEAWWDNVEEAQGNTAEVLYAGRLDGADLSQRSGPHEMVILATFGEIVSATREEGGPWDIDSTPGNPSSLRESGVITTSRGVLFDERVAQVEWLPTAELADEDVSDDDLAGAPETVELVDGFWPGLFDESVFRTIDAEGETIGIYGNRWHSDVVPTQLSPADGFTDDDVWRLLSGDQGRQLQQGIREASTDAAGADERPGMAPQAVVVEPLSSSTVDGTSVAGAGVRVGSRLRTIAAVTGPERAEVLELSMLSVGDWAGPATPLSLGVVTDDETVGARVFYVVPAGLDRVVLQTPDAAIELPPASGQVTQPLDPEGVELTITGFAGDRVVPGLPVTSARSLGSADRAR